MKKLNKRALRYGANNTILIAGAVVIFILVNLLAAAVSEKFPSARLDLTRNGLFNIGATTKSVLADLDESGDEVVVYYLKNTSEELTYIKEVVLKYLGASKSLEYKTLNYVKNPASVKKYGELDSLTEGSLIVDNITSGRFRIIPYEDMFIYDSQSQGLSAANLESKLTNALAYVVSEDESFVYFSTGHGEADPSEMGGVLAEENISALQLSLKTAEVPDDCGILYIISPVYDFTAEEIDRLDSYLDRGGNVQLAVEPGVQLERLEGYLGEWGVTLGGDNVIETDPAHMREDSQTGMYFIYPQVAQSALTKTITEKNLLTLGVLCRSIHVASVPNTEIKRTNVFYTTKNGISSDIDTGSVTEGSFDLCIMLEKTVGDSYDKTARLLIGGSSSFWGVTNYSNFVSLTGLLSEPSVGNNAFFVDSAYEMLGLEGTKLTIESKSLSATTLMMTEAQQSTYRIMFCYALPALIILLGLIIWLRRRHL